MNQDELKKRLLLLMNGINPHEYNTLSRSSTVTTKSGKKVQSSKLELGLKKVEKTATIPETIAFEGEHHFPGYNYLGPGTKFKQRQALGIEPINDTDRI